MSFQIDGVRSRGFLVRLGVVSALMMGLGACGPNYGKDHRFVPEPSKVDLEKLVTAAPQRKNWQKGLEHLFDLADMKADRYEWSPAVKGSSRQIWNRNKRAGFPDFADTSGWYGCGWAHYDVLPKGVKFSPVRVAIRLDKDDEVSYVFMAWDAHTRCRYAAPPTLADGSKAKFPPYVNDQGSGREKRTMHTDLGWVQSLAVLGEFNSLEIQSGLTDEQARDVFAVLNKKPSKAKLGKVTLETRR